MADTATKPGTNGTAAPTNAELAARVKELETRKPPASPRPSSPSSGVAKLATSATSGKRLVVVGTIGTGVLTLIAAYRKPNAKRSPFRVVVGVFAAGVILAALAEVAPKLAAAFSMLMLGTAAFVVGGDAWAGISAITAPGK